jgi:hypothetical protein
MGDDANSRKLTVQTPGEGPGVKPDEILELLKLSPVDLAGGVAALSSVEIQAAIDAENAGEKRAAYLEILESEAFRRLEDGEGAEGSDKPIELELSPDAPTIGNAKDFRRVAWRDVPNREKLTQPVLTADGWLLPPPRAEG